MQTARTTKAGSKLKESGYKMKVHELLKNLGGWDYYSILCQGQDITKEGKTSLRNIIAGLENRQNVINAVMLYDVVAYDRAKKIVYCVPQVQSEKMVA